jgi:transposase
MLIALGRQLEMLKSQIRNLDAKIIAAHRNSELSRRLEAIPGVGPRVATALVASIADPNAFRQMAAWVGLVPKQNSSQIMRTRCLLSTQID